MIVPDQEAAAVVVPGGDHIDVGFAAHAMTHDVLDVAAKIAFGLEPVAAELSQHAKAVEHGLVDAVGSEIAKAIEIRLLVEHEGPGHSALDDDVGAPRQLVGPDHTL